MYNITFGFIVVMIWFLIHVPIQVLSCEFQQFLGPVKMLNDKVYSETVNIAYFIQLKYCNVFSKECGKMGSDTMF